MSTFRKQGPAMTRLRLFDSSRILEAFLVLVLCEAAAGGGDSIIGFFPPRINELYSLGLSYYL